jgi:hypothetical protein
VGLEGSPKGVACQKEDVCDGSDNCQGIGIMDMMRKGLLGRAYISMF